MSIKTLGQLIEVLTLQKSNLATYQTQVGATLADITAVTNELNNLNAIIAFAEVADGFKQTVFQIKQAMYNGDPDIGVPGFPAALVPPTFTGLVAGSLKRTNDRNARFKAAPGYTHEIGVALGIESADGSEDRPEPSSVLPVIEVFAAESGYLCSVVVRNRVESDMWQVLVRPTSGGASWTVATSATGKSTDFVYTPSAGDAGKSVQLEIRVQLRKNNENYGQPSAIMQATVNP